MSQQILGNVPPVVFVKDKEAAAVKEVIVILDCRIKYYDTQMCLNTERVDVQ